MFFYNGRELGLLFLAKKKLGLFTALDGGRFTIEVRYTFLEVFYGQRAFIWIKQEKTAFDPRFSITLEKKPVK